MIRYILFYYLSLVLSTFNFVELRNQMGLNLKIFSYGFMAWQSISPIICMILEQYSTLAGKTVTGMIRYDIENQVCCYFESLFLVALVILPDEVQKLDYAEKKAHYSCQIDYFHQLNLPVSLVNIELQSLNLNPKLE